MDLKMEVYTPALELVGILEIYKSIIWDEYAFKAGSFSVDSLITEESISLLKPENIIWIEGETAGIIEMVQESVDDQGPYITARGPTLTGLLERRILWGLYNLYDTAPAMMQYLVNDCAVNPTRGVVEERKMPGLVLSDGISDGGEKIRKQKTGGSLLEAETEIGEANQTAFGIRFNAKIPQMEFWTRRGVNRSVKQSSNEPVFFSTELDDVLSSEYNYDASEWKNVALVAGEGEGNARVYLTVGDGGGEPPKTLGPWVPSTLPLSANWNSVTYGNGKFVTVASNSDKAAYSEDGITWETTTLPASVNWQSVTYGNRRFVAVAMGSAISAYSDDGITWEEANMPYSAKWQSVAYGNGKFVAVVNGGSYVACSSDGINWSAATFSKYVYWPSVTYGNGKFVAVVYGQSTAMYSQDGITWEAATLPKSANWQSITYGNGRFVAVPYGNSTVHSEDGVIWESSVMPAYGSWSGITYGIGKFMAVLSGSDNSYYSDDGVTWTMLSLPSSSSWKSVAYGNEKFVAVAFNSNIAAYCEPKQQDIATIGTGAIGQSYVQ